MCVKAFDVLCDTEKFFYLLVHSHLLIELYDMIYERKHKPRIDIDENYIFHRNPTDISRKCLNVPPISGIFQPTFRSHSSNFNWVSEVESVYRLDQQVKLLQFASASF